MIRVAESAELTTLQEIELASNSLFTSLGMTAVAQLEPTSISDLSAYQAAGRAFVATAEHEKPVGFLVLREVDGNAHIEQVSVYPDHGRRGIGRRLLDRAAEWARHHGLKALTLTTFAKVPWNAPYYARLGFRPFADDELTPGLRAIRDHNAQGPLAQWPRVTMRFDLESGSPATLFFRN